MKLQNISLGKLGSVARFTSAVGLGMAIAVAPTGVWMEGVWVESLATAQVVQTPPATQLTERVSAINTCRNTGNNPLPVYSDTAQTQAIGRLQPFTKVTLTGILGPGIAQVREPIVGWIQSATLQTDCNARPGGTGTGTGSGTGTGTGTGTGAPRRGTCFVVLTNGGLFAYDTPGGPQQTFEGQNDGPDAGSRVFAVDPVQRAVANNRRFVRAFYTSISNAERVGWISEGPVGGTNNLGTCPAN
jgi:hypothetical protein